MSEFDFAILKDTAHRPWPMPAAPWVMTQTWHDLLFAHWPVDAAVLRDARAAALTLDVFENRAWIGIVPFRMTNVAPRGVPALPRLSAFPELNVRTYVRVGDRPGVFFFSLDAANAIAVAAARVLFGLPYYAASMSVVEQDGLIRYTSRRTAAASPPAELAATYQPTGPGVSSCARNARLLPHRALLLVHASTARAGRTGSKFTTRRGRCRRRSAAFDILRMTEQIGMTLPAEQVVLHFARRQDVVAFPMTRVSAGRTSGPKVRTTTVMADLKAALQASAHVENVRVWQVIHHPVPVDDETGAFDER